MALNSSGFSHCKKHAVIKHIIWKSCNSPGRKKTKPLEPLWFLPFIKQQTLNLYHGRCFLTCSQYQSTDRAIKWRISTYCSHRPSSYAPGWPPALTVTEILANKNYQARLGRKYILYIPSRIFVTLGLLHTLVSPVPYTTYLFHQSDARSGYSISTVIWLYSSGCDSVPAGIPH